MPFDPLRRCLHRRRDEAAAVNAAVLLPLDEAGVLENAQVPGDRRQRDRERPGELAHRRLGRPRQVRDDRASRRVRQRAERRVEGGGTVNHMVKYIAGRASVKPSDMPDSGK